MRFSLPRSLLAALAAAASLAALIVAPFGCDTAKLTSTPDDAGCIAPEVEYPCKLQPAGEPGCGSDVGNANLFERDVMIDGSAPAKCTLIINSILPDQDNQCSQLGSCTCNEADGGFAWSCLL